MARNDEKHTHRSQLISDDALASEQLEQHKRFIADDLHFRQALSTALREHTESLVVGLKMTARA
jgi:hypothetical protein